MANELREAVVEAMARAIYARWDGGSNPWDDMLQRRHKLGLDVYHASQLEALDNARAALTALLALLDARGLAIVPKVATEEMLDAAFIENNNEAVYAAMLSAAPSPLTEAGDGE